MEKQVSIVIAASGEIKDIALTEGATVRDVLNEINLRGYQLSRKGGDVLDPDTDLYSEALDSEKLYATPEDVSVGGGNSPPTALKERLLDFLYRWGICRPDLQELPLWDEYTMSEAIKKKEFRSLAIDP